MAVFDRTSQLVYVGDAVEYTLLGEEGEVEQTGTAVVVAIDPDTEFLTLVDANGERIEDVAGGNVTMLYATY